jgi:lysyl-tRNA synthetase class I
VYDQLKKELALHSSKAKKYILLHDTSTFGEFGEIAAYNCNTKPNDVCDSSPRKGLWQAVEEFLENNNEWILKERFMHNNGLTILVRK